MPLLLNMRELYAPKSMGQNPDTPIYMETISGVQDLTCEAFQSQQEYSTVVTELIIINGNDDAVLS